MKNQQFVHEVQDVDYNTSLEPEALYVMECIKIHICGVFLAPIKESVESFILAPILASKVKLLNNIRFYLHIGILMCKCIFINTCVCFLAEDSAKRLQAVRVPAEVSWNQLELGSQRGNISNFSFL